MKKISNLSVLLGLGLAATATGVNAETQTTMQSQSQLQNQAQAQLQAQVQASQVNAQAQVQAIAPTSSPVSATVAPVSVTAPIVESAPISNDSATIRAINTELNLSRPKAIAQNVTSVSQLSDVRPTDWAFTALQSLVERYGCIAGYPDRTFRGKQATSRYEFAAGLNACLDKINEIISAGLADKVSKEDLATLQKLQEEFAAELATLRGRVDALDAKTAKLEAQQFSTTTKLSGLAFFNVTGASSGTVVGASTAAKPNVTMSGLVWLTLNTSFTGKDSLITQLAVGNGNSPYNNYTAGNLFNTTGVPFTDQTAGATANTFILRELSYQFPVFEKASLVVGPRINFYKYFDGIRFIYPWNTTFNSINSTLLTNAKRGAGAVFMTPLGNQFDFKIGYLSESNEFLPAPRSADNPSKGLFSGNNALTAELGFKPSDAFKLRLLYSRTNMDAVGGVVGGAGATPSLPALVGGANNAQSDVFVANFDWLVSKGFGLFGRYGYGTTNINLSAGGSSNVVMQTFQIGAAFPDLFKEGAQAMISFGMPFNYTSGKSNLIAGSGGGDGGTQYDLELSYIYPVTKNISIVPSAYFIFSPNNISSNPTIFVGNLQAVFSF